MCCLPLDISVLIHHWVSILLLSTIGHIRANSSLGQHIITTLEYFQISTGLCGNPLERIIHQEYVDSLCLETMRELLHSVQATIRLPTLLATVIAPRRNDFAS